MSLISSRIWCCSCRNRTQIYSTHLLRHLCKTAKNLCKTAILEYEGVGWGVIPAKAKHFAESRPF